MIGEHPVTTKNQYMASLLLKEDDSAVHLEQDRRAPLKQHLYRIRCGVTHEGRSRNVGIYGQGLLESIASASQQETNIGLPQFHFMLNTQHAYIDADPDSLRVVKVPSASGWHTQSSLWESDPPTTDAVQAYAEPGAILYSDMRRILEQPVLISRWGVGSPLQPRVLGPESPTVAAEVKHPDKRTIWSEILDRFDVIAQWEDNWDGLESKKPIEGSLVRAKRLMAKLLDAAVSKGYSWGDPSPFISSDEDGYITVEWQGDGRRLRLLIEEEEIEYTKLWRINTKRKVRTYSMRGDDCFEIWEWLING